MSDAYSPDNRSVYCWMWTRHSCHWAGLGHWDAPRAHWDNPFPSSSRVLHPMQLIQISLLSECPLKFPDWVPQALLSGDRFTKVTCVRESGGLFPAVDQEYVCHSGQCFWCHSLKMNDRLCIYKVKQGQVIDKIRNIGFDTKNQSLVVTWSLRMILSFMQDR